MHDPSGSAPPQQRPARKWQCTAALPLIDDDRLLGALFVARDGTDHLLGWRVLDDLAAHAAAALGNATLLGSLQSEIVERRTAEMELQEAGRREGGGQGSHSTPRLPCVASFFELSGHEVRTAADGGEAVVAAEIFSPEAVVLDISRPVLDGDEVAPPTAQRVGGKEAVLLVCIEGWLHGRPRRAGLAAAPDRGGQSVRVQLRPSRLAR